jgi:hypothetical protein
MKISVFVPTGEHRVAVEGEWVIDSLGSCWKVAVKKTIDDFNIVARHEIEVPEGAAELQYCFDTKLSGWHMIQLPKQKVKRDGWVNIYRHIASVGLRGEVYDTKEKAYAGRDTCNDYVDTIHIEWEE